MALMFILSIGVALGTWFDSVILVDPPIQEARELKNWYIALPMPCFYLTKQQLQIIFRFLHLFCIFPSCRALRNSQIIADVLVKRDYMKYNPTISLRTDQKATLICNVSPSQKVLKQFSPFVPLCLFILGIISETSPEVSDAFTDIP